MIHLVRSLLALARPGAWIAELEGEVIAHLELAEREGSPPGCRRNRRGATRAAVSGISSR